MLQTLAFGPVRLAWELDPAALHWDEFLASYRAYLDDGPGDLRVEAAVQDVPPGAPRPPLPNSFIRRRSLRGREFDLGDGLIRGDLRGDACRCAIHPALLHGTGLRVLEQFFYLLYHHVILAGAERTAGFPFLLHSSAALQDGRAHVFCGPAGRGKSTAAALSTPRPVLTDECTALDLGPGGLRATGTPINPFCREKRPGSAPVAGLHLLSQAAEHARRPVPRDEAVPRLTAEVIAPVGLLEDAPQRGLVRALDCALALYRTGLVGELYFRRDPGFWRVIAP